MEFRFRSTVSLFGQLGPNPGDWLLTGRARLEPVEDLSYGTPAPEEASYNAAAYAEAYASYQCMLHPRSSFLARERRLTNFDLRSSDDDVTDYSYVY